MKAIIFAAGLGTRLKPLTNNKPKALVTIDNKTLLEIAIEKLISEGFNDIVINVHHFADMMIEFINNLSYNAKINISDERDELLDTGGGIKKASHFFSKEPFLAYNVDVLSNINLSELYTFHLKNDALATLAVRERDTSRYFLFNPTNELCGWRNNATKEEIISKKSPRLKPLAFSGIHIISPQIFSLFPQSKKFSITQAYIELSSTNKIMGYCHNNDFWIDMGKPEAIEKGRIHLQSLK